MVTLRFLAVLLVLGAGPGVFAAQEMPPKEAASQLLLLRIDTDKELARKDIEALDKRIDDQVSRIADIGSSVDRFGILLTGFGVLITVVLASLGLLGYFSVASRAREQAKAAATDEAMEAAKRYFDENAVSVRKQIESLEERAKQAHGQIDDQVNEFRSHVAAAKLETQPTIGQSRSAIATPTDNTRALAKAAEQLKGTPESSYKFEDWDTRAYAAYLSGQLDEAALYWKRAAEVSDASSLDAAAALFNRGVTLGQLGRQEEALAAYDLVDSRYGADPAPGLREQVAKAQVNKGVVLGQLDRREEALSTFDLVDSRYGADPAPGLREQVASALFNKGVALGQLGRPEEALAACDLVDSRYGADPAPGLREPVANALVNKGVTLRQLDRREEALAAYDLVDSRYGADPAPGLREQVAIARNDKGFNFLMKAKKQWPEDREDCLGKARAALESALINRPDWGMVQGNLAYVLWLLGDATGAEARMRAGLAAAQNGGEELYQGTLEDIAQHPVPPDEGFRALVERLWEEWRGGQSS